MNIKQLAAYVAVAVMSAATGAWLTSPQSDPAPAAMSVSRPAAEPAKNSRDNAPLIAVSRAGTVTLRVEQQPLEWVLEEIARQSGSSDPTNHAIAGKSLVNGATTTTTTTTIADPGVCASSHGGAHAPATALLQAIAQGSDSERYDSLLWAQAAGLSLPDEALKRLYENDTSDRVRSLAFQRLLASRASNIEEMQKALEAGLAVPNETVRDEARRRMDSLLNGQGTDTSLH